MKWQIVPLASVIVESRNGLYKPDTFYGRGTPILKMFNIGRLDGRWDLTRVDKLEVTQDELRDFGLCAGDLMINRVNSRELVGKCALVDEKTAGSVFESKNMKVRFNTDKVEPAWVALWLNGASGRAQIEQRLKQIVGMATINRDDLLSLQLPLPPLPEQRRIAARLREQLAEVERARAALRSQVDAAEKLLPVYLEIQFGSAEAKSWPLRPFTELVNNHDGIRIPLKLADRAKRKGEHPYYGASGIIDHIDKYLFDGDYLLIAEDGANLLSRSTPIAFKASGKFWVNNHAHVVRPRKSVSLDYLLHFFAATDVSGYVTGSAQPKLSQGSLNRILVPLPSADEQRRVTSTLDALQKTTQALVTEIRQRLAALEKLPAALLREAFGGKN